MSGSERICFVAPRYPEGHAAGGAETLLKNLAIKAAANGHKVTFLTTCAISHFTWANELQEGKKELDGLDVIFFPVNSDRDINSFLKVQESISRGIPVTDREQEIWLENNVNSDTLCEYLEEHHQDFDKIITGPYLFGLIYYAALICPEKTFLVPCLHDEPFAYLSAFKKLFTSIKGIIFNTEPERDLANRIFELQNSTYVVGMGLDSFDVDPEAFSRKHNLSTPYVLYSGRRELLKGTSTLIDYMAAFRQRTGRDVKLVLTGSGTIDIPVELQPHVIDVGFVSESEKHEAMAGATVFCHFSVNESLGIVILESWLSGTPVMVHAKSEVLRYQCEKSNGGLWFRVYPEFEDELILLLDNPELCKQLAVSGREYVLKEYSWEAVERKLLNVLD